MGAVYNWRAPISRAMKQILVTGATGTVGRQVVSQLLATEGRVGALTRDPASANLPDGVDIRRGDLTIPQTLDACLDGVDVVFLVWTADSRAVSRAIEQIARYARQIVFLSSPHQTPHPLFQQPNPLAAMHAEIELSIQRSGLDWTFLRPGMFAANARSWWAPQIRAGDVVRWPYADAPTAPIHEADIAAVAVSALLDTRHKGADYVLTGPQSLTQREQVEIIGDVIGRQLHFEEISPEEARRELGFPLPAMNMLLNAWAAAVGQPALVTSTLADITRNPARSFRDWVIENVEEFKP
jgi:uncharacterized protein YbjT (DUF2867 family)